MKELISIYVSLILVFSPLFGQTKQDARLIQQRKSEWTDYWNVRLIGGELFPHVALLGLKGDSLVISDIEIQSDLAKKNEYHVIEQYMIKSIEHLHHDAYDSVFAISKYLQSKFPDMPYGYFIAANAYGTYMRDYRVRIYESQFDSTISLAIELTKERLIKEPTVENQFLLGISEGYKSMHQYSKGSRIEAISGVLRSYDALLNSYNQDPEFVDPLLGLSLYNFALFRLGQKLYFNVGPKFDDIISDLQNVQYNGKFVSYSAMYTLQLIYQDLNKFQKAMNINNELYKLFPQNPSCLYNRALLLEKLNNYSAAANIWRKLISQLNSQDKVSNGYLAECHYHLFQIYQKQSKIENSINELKKASKYAMNYEKKDEMEGPFLPFKYYKKEIENELKHRKSDGS